MIEAFGCILLITIYTFRDSAGRTSKVTGYSFGRRGAPSKAIFRGGDFKGAP